MKRISNRESLRIINEVSPAPLLMLFLLLVLIFLIAAPLLARRTAPGTVQPVASVTLAVDHDQKIALDGQPVAQSALLAALRQRLEKQPHLGVVVKMDHKLPVQNLVEIMAVLKTAGVPLTAVAPTTPAPPAPAPAKP